MLAKGLAIGFCGGDNNHSFRYSLLFLLVSFVFAVDGCARSIYLSQRQQKKWWRAVLYSIDYFDLADTQYEGTRGLEG